MTKTYNARDLVSLSPFHINETLETPHDIVFEDGVTLTSTRNKTFYSSFFWEFHREYPNTPIKSTHHVLHVLNGQPGNSDTHKDLLEIISIDVINTYQLIQPESKENVLSLIYKITNDINNDVAPEAEAHVESLDMLDFLEVVEHPAIREAVDSVPATVQSKDDIIQHTYDKVVKILKTDETLSSNSLATMARAKLANVNQIVQCIAFKGFQTEVDGKILKEPILANFAEGMGRLYDYTAESRSAAKSHYFAEAPLEDAEYFARRLQLLTTTITGLVYNDCGTDKYLNWLIRPPEFDERGKMTYPGDLKFLVGKYYLEPDGKELKEIKGNEKHLNNKMVRLRSSIFCRTPNKHKICAVCFGGLSHNVSRFANLGHLCSATMTQQTTQSVLSTKHLDSSSRSTDIKLSADQMKFFRVSDARNSYIMKKDYEGEHTAIVINSDQAPGLADAMAFDHFDTLNFEWITQITDVDVRYFDGKGMMNFSINIGQEKRKGVFTVDFLKYLKKHRWATDDLGNFVISLKDWNFNLPIMSLPDMEYSYSDHSDQIAKMIESNLEKMTERAKPNSPALTLQELFAKVNDKLSMNIAPLEAIIAAIMIPNSKSIRMARGEDNAILGVANRIVKSRHLGNSLAFKDQVETLLSSHSFFADDRPDSVFDSFFAPKEVIAHEESKLSMNQ